MTVLQIAILATSLAQQPGAPPAKPTLDYNFFKERVQPIFLKKRPGHARCVACHEHGSPPLQPLAAGATTWTDEQSRKNFDMWKNFVNPGNPLKSQLLLHPLAETGGGDTTVYLPHRMQRALCPTISHAGSFDTMSRRHFGQTYPLSVGTKS